MGVRSKCCKVRHDLRHGGMGLEQTGGSGHSCAWKPSVPTVTEWDGDKPGGLLRRGPRSLETAEGQQIWGERPSGGI